MFSKLVILMRHGKPSSDAGVEDFFIPLSPDGIKAERRLCQRLEKEGFFPQAIWASPFQRAKDTGEIIGEHFQKECTLEEALGVPFDEDLLLKKLQTAKESTIALVGHGPSLTDFAHLLLGKKEFLEIVPKSSAVIIAFQGTIDRGFGTLINFLH